MTYTSLYCDREPCAGLKVSGNSNTGGKFSDLAPRVIHESKGPWKIVRTTLSSRAQYMRVAYTVDHIKHSGYEANSAAVNSGRSVERKLWP